MAVKKILKILNIFMINLTFILLVLIAGFAGCGKNTDGEPEPGNTGLLPEETFNNPSEPEPDIIKKNIMDIPVEDNADGGRCGDGFVFVYNGVNVYMGDYIENILTEMGPPTDYYESESCTSEGMMQTYCYGGGLEIASSAKTESDGYRIFMVSLTDDINSTAEGIYIGQTADDMIKIYGTGYEEIFGCYKYVKNGAGLSFDVDGDIITCITYNLINV